MTPLDKVESYVRRCQKKGPHWYRRAFVHPITDDTVYIQIPKNASSTIKYIAAKAGSRLRRPRAASKFNFSQVKTALVLTRNPFDRLVSCYRNRIEGHGQPDQQISQKLQPGPLRNLDQFPEFVEAIKCIPDQYADMHYRSQAWFIKELPSTLDICYIDMNKILEKWPTILDLLGLDKETPPRYQRNSWSDTEPFQRNSRSDIEPLKRQKLINEYYKDERVIDMVRERYKKDFELFGYSEEVSDY